MRNLRQHPPKAAIGLAALSLGLVVALAFSSVAGSSTGASAPLGHSIQPSGQQIHQLLEKGKGQILAAACRGPQRRQLSCRSHRSRSGSAAGNRTLLRSHFDLSDPACPVWNIDTPHAGFATVATGATAVCVEAVSGHDVYRRSFSFNQIPEIPILELWAYTNHHWARQAHVSSDFGNCSVLSVDIAVGTLNVERVKLCLAKLSAHAPVFPPAGTYRGKLIVITLSPFWTGATMLDENSYDFCYFCR